MESVSFESEQREEEKKNDKSWRKKDNSDKKKKSFTAQLSRKVIPRISRWLSCQSTV